MEESEKFCPNCRRSIAASNFVIHTVHCERKIQLCRLCNEPVPRSDFDDHLKDCHSLEDCPFCEVPKEKWQLEHHKEVECPQKHVSCKYCKKKYPPKEIAEHKLACGSRTDECPFCGQFVMIQDKDNHSLNCQKDKKVKTLALCKYCELEFPFEEYPEHESSCGSRTENCDLCNKFVMLKDKLSHAKKCEKVESQQDMFFCQHCKSGINYRDYHDHVLNCKSRPIKCPFCGGTVKFEDLDMHDRICQGSSENESMVSSAKEPIFCQYCNSEVAVEHYEFHELRCGSRVEQCDKCNKLFSIRNADQHQRECQKELSERKSKVNNVQELECDQSPIPCSYCFVEFPPDCLFEHVETCKDRTEECPNCKSSFFFKDRLKHNEICSLASKGSFYNCKHCNVKFRYDSLMQHEESCSDRIEICVGCDNPVMIRDKVKHKESCVSKPLEQFLCPICQELKPSDELQKHYKDCFENNAHYLQRQTKNESFIEPESVAYTESSRSFTQENQWQNERDTKSCPYCHDSIPEKRFQNHKKFCNKAFKTCPLCEFTFHAEEEVEHSISCEVIKEIENSPANEKRNPYAVQNEYNLRKYEKNSQTCYYCLSKIPMNHYPSHVKQCAENLKKCSFCQETYHKDKERDHMIRCVSSRQKKQDQYLYPAFQNEKQRSQTNEPSGIVDPRNCPKCNMEVPDLCFNNHLKYCKPSLEPCIYCSRLIHINDLEHGKNCTAKKKDHGAKPKNRSKKPEKEKPGMFTRFCDTIKDYVGLNDSPYSSNYPYPSSYPYAPNYPYPKRDILIPYQTPPSAPVEETLIPCEFCNQLVLIEDLTIHETGCNPDLTSLSTAITNQSNRITSNPDVKESKREYITFSDNAESKDELIDMRFDPNEKDLKVLIHAQKSNRSEDEIKKEYADSFIFMQNLNPKRNTMNTTLDGEQNEITTMEEKEIQSAYQDKTIEKRHKIKDPAQKAEKVLENTENEKTTLDYTFSDNQKLEEIYNQQENFSNNQKLEEIYKQETHSLKMEKRSKSIESSQTIMYARDNPRICQQSKNEERSCENEKTRRSVLHDDDNLSADPRNLEYINNQKMLLSQKKERKYEEGSPTDNQNTYELRSGQIYNRDYVSPKAKMSRNLETNSCLDDQSKTHTKPGEFLESDYYLQLHSNQNAAYDKREVIKNSSNEKAPFENEKLCHTWQALDADKDVNDKKLNEEFTRDSKETSQKSYAFENNYKKGDVSNEYSDFTLIDFQDESNTLHTDVKNKFHFDHGQNMPSSFSGKQNKINSESRMKVVTSIEGDDSCIISSSEMKGAIKIDRLRWKISPQVEKHQKRPDLNIQDEDSYANQKNLNVDGYNKTASGSDIPNKKEYPYIEKKFHGRYSAYKIEKVEDSLKSPKNENFQSNEQAMEVDDENQVTDPKFMSKDNFYTKLNDLSSLCNVSPEPPSSEDKECQSNTAAKERDQEFNAFSNKRESDLEGYYERLLEIDQIDNSKIMACKVCGNEMCICKIKRSLLTARSNSYTEETENEDFYAHYKETSKTENKNLDWELLEKKEFKERMEKLEREKWKKYRENFDRD